MLNVNRITPLLAAAVLALLPLPVFADFEADPAKKLEVRAENAIARMQEKLERSRPYFEDAYAIVVWPGITRVGFGFGGAYGKGVVIEQDQAIGTVGYWQFSSGIQAGAKGMTLVLFFKDKESLESLKRGEIQFVGQAGIDFGVAGAHGTPTYNEGVAIIPMTNIGLMGEFAAAGVKYTYRPYAAPVSD
jgi:lipid-binding SYLF domain-containing protein